MALPFFPNIFTGFIGGRPNAVRVAVRAELALRQAQGERIRTDHGELVEPCVLCITTTKNLEVLSGI